MSTPAPRLMLDRTTLLMWASGILLCREDDKLMSCDERSAREAEEALERGEVVGLLVNARLFSMLQLVDGRYVETVSLNQGER